MFFSDQTSFVHSYSSPVVAIFPTVPFLSAAEQGHEVSDRSTQATLRKVLSYGGSLEAITTPNPEVVRRTIGAPVIFHFKSC